MDIWPDVGRPSSLFSVQSDSSITGPATSLLILSLSVFHSISIFHFITPTPRISNYPVSSFHHISSSPLPRLPHSLYIIRLFRGLGNRMLRQVCVREEMSLVFFSLSGGILSESVSCLSLVTCLLRWFTFLSFSLSLTHHQTHTHTHSEIIAPVTCHSVWVFTKWSPGAPCSRTPCPSLRPRTLHSAHVHTHTEKHTHTGVSVSILTNTG